MSRFAPTAPLENLKLRAQVMRELRHFFSSRGFLEVDTPLLSHDTVVDRHLDPVSVRLPTDVRVRDSGHRMFLQTSPEFAMKRLLAAGLKQIYQITHAFRVGESGALHNPEFTMVEWYRVGDDMRVGMALLAELACELFATSHCDRKSFADAFGEHVELDPLRATCDELRAVISRFGIELPGDAGPEDRDLLIEMLFGERVQPRLGLHRPVILYDFPASQAALARLRVQRDVSVAERFELFFRGVELANGYHELCDAEELLQRNQAVNQNRLADGKQELPEESRLLEAMRSGLPNCAGVALGLDRVLMLRCHAADIREVIPFPIDIA